MYYRTCPHCGSNLDPSETCDCEIEQRNEQEEQERGAAVWRNSKHPARPWKTLADERGGSKAIQRMREVFEEELSKAGGGAGEWEE